MLQILKSLFRRKSPSTLEGQPEQCEVAPRDNREFVAALARAHCCRRIAEVGVWKGQLSRMLLALPEVEHLLMVDPWKYECNLFESTSSGPHPSMMDSGVYNCRMGESTLTQAELDQLYQDLVTELQAAHPGKTAFLRLPSLAAAPRVADASLDLVFIDAIHLYEDVKADIAAWLPKVKPEGILAGDDYCSAFQGVIDAVDETFPAKIRHIDENTGVWYVYRKDLLSVRNGMANGAA